MDVTSDEVANRVKSKVLPGMSGQRAWWLACERGQIGNIEKEVSKTQERYARLLRHLEDKSIGTHSLNGKILQLVMQIDPVAELLEMTQPIVQPGKSQEGGEDYCQDEHSDDPYANAESSGGGTALHIASSYGHTDIVSFLLSLDAPQDRYDANGRHPLHLACTQGWADVVKLLLLNCPSRHMQRNLLKTQDCRAMCCRLMCDAARREWLSAGISAHVSGSFLRRKLGVISLPRIQWWKNRKDRRKNRRRKGRGIAGDESGARDFERTRDLILAPPPPNVGGDQSKIFAQNSQCQSYKQLDHKAMPQGRMQRRTRSPLSSLSNAIIWRTALNYDEAEEIQLGTAVAHAPRLKLRLEEVKTVDTAKRILGVIRPALALGLYRRKRSWGDRSGGFIASHIEEIKLIAARKRRRLEQGGSNLDWQSVDEAARQKCELEHMAREDEICLRARPYLTLPHLKLCRLQLLFRELVSGKDSSDGLPIEPKLMPPLCFARLAGLVGEFASASHVKNILKTIPHLIEESEFARQEQGLPSSPVKIEADTKRGKTWASLFTLSGRSQQQSPHLYPNGSDGQVGCTFINFVLFWLHAERLERHPCAGLRKRGREWCSPEGQLDPEDLAHGLRAASLGNSMFSPSQTIESVIWLQRIRARMRVDHAISRYSNADSSNARNRSRLLMSVDMGVGIIPAWRSKSLASRRKERASLVKFEPAEEFTKQEVIRQQRMRQNKLSQQPTIEGNNGSSDTSGTGNGGAPLPPPPLPPTVAEIEQTESSMFEKELNDDGTPKKRPMSAKPAKTAADQISAKRLEDARQMAKKEAERETLRKKRREEQMKKQQEEAKKRQEAYLEAQRQEKKQIERMKREERKREIAAKRQKKNKAKAERNASNKRKRAFKKNRKVEDSKIKTAQANNSRSSDRRRIDSGFVGKDKEKKEAEEKERLAKARAELTAKREARKRENREKERLRQQKERLKKMEEERQKWLSLRDSVSSLSAKDSGWAGLHRSAEEIKLRKQEISERRMMNRRNVMKEILGDDEYQSMSEKANGKPIDPCRPPDDPDSVLERKHLSNKGRFDTLKSNLEQINAALGVNAQEGGDKNLDPRDQIPWTLSDSFSHTGYAHRTGKFRLKPLERWA